MGLKFEDHCVSVCVQVCSIVCLIEIMSVCVCGKSFLLNVIAEELWKKKVEVGKVKFRGLLQNLWQKECFSFVKSSFMCEFTSTSV